MDLRIKQLTEGGSEESSDDSGDKKQLDTEFFQQIGQDLSSKEQFGKPLSTLLASIKSEIWEESHPKVILLKKLDTYEKSSNSKTLQVKKVNQDE